MQLRPINEVPSFMAVAVVAAMLLLVFMMVVSPQPTSAAVPASQAFQASDLVGDEFPLGDVIEVPSGVIYAKYEGVDGESVDASHRNWIDVLAMEWGAERSSDTARSAVRSARSVELRDLTLRYWYDKSTPELVDDLLKGEVIPKLEIEFTFSTGDRARYLRYELTNVSLTSYAVAAVGGRPMVEIGNTFEEIKVTYTPFDEEGGALGNVGYQYTVPHGG